MAAALTPLRIWLKDLFVLLLSMVPIAENRLAIPVDVYKRQSKGRGQGRMADIGGVDGGIC